MFNHKHNGEDNSCQYGKITKADIELLQGAGGAELLIYMSLAIHAFNENRTAFPTIKTIQSLTSLSRSSVLRGLTKLKERNAIVEVGKTSIGSIKYKLGGPRFKTGGPRSDTPGGRKSDTPPVQDLRPIKLNRKDNTKNILASANMEKDELMFVEFWNKWNDHVYTKWISENPMQRYQSMRIAVFKIWKNKQVNKDMSYEIQVCDIYIMQRLVQLGKDFNGPARFWTGIKWEQGLFRWLSSSTPSHMGGNRKSFIPHCIKVKIEESPESANKEVQSAEPLISHRGKYLKRVQDAKEAHEIHNDSSILKDTYQWIHDDMKFNLKPQEIEMIRKDNQFQEFFITIGE
jgi:hypothetical protein